MGGTGASHELLRLAHKNLCSSETCFDTLRITWGMESGVSIGYFDGSLMRLRSEINFDTPRIPWGMESGVKIDDFDGSLMRLRSKINLDTPRIPWGMESGVSIGYFDGSLMRLSSEINRDTPALDEREISEADVVLCCFVAMHINT